MRRVLLSNIQYFSRNSKMTLYNFLRLDGKIVQAELLNRFEEGIPSSVKVFETGVTEIIIAKWQNGALIEQENQDRSFFPGITVTISKEFIECNDWPLSVISRLFSSKANRLVESGLVQYGEDENNHVVTFDVHGATAVLRFVANFLDDSRGWATDFIKFFFGGNVEALAKEMQQTLIERSNEINES